MFTLFMLFASKSSFERLLNGRVERENKRLKSHLVFYETHTAGSERDSVQTAHHNSTWRAGSVHMGAKGRTDVLKRVYISTALKKTSHKFRVLVMLCT